MHYDVFNGDADGIIALLQLRLSEPKTSQLITGVKRDIALLKQVLKSNDVTSATVLDVSMEKNQEALKQLLAQHIPVFYCDHHRTGEIPKSEFLETLVNLDSEVCTSLLINQKLKGKYQAWAIAAAFGDNLNQVAQAKAEQMGLASEQVDFLKELGMLINYNGYGASLSDLHIEPADLYQKLLHFPNPFDLLEDQTSIYYQLKAGYAQDHAKVAELTPIHKDKQVCVYQLPCEAWARRISGVFGNELANFDPTRAHAVLTQNQDGESFLVSVRAPLNNRIGADEVCSMFATGGGRKAAAGINQLPVNQMEKFVQTFSDFYL